MPAGNRLAAGLEIFNRQPPGLGLGVEMALDLEYPDRAEKPVQLFGRLVGGAAGDAEEPVLHTKYRPESAKIATPLTRGFCFFLPARRSTPRLSVG